VHLGWAVLLGVSIVFAPGFAAKHVMLAELCARAPFANVATPEPS